MLPGAFRRIWPAAAALFVLGAGGIAALMLTTYPVLWARWAFLLSLIMALTGAAMPVMAYLHQRFTTATLTHERTILRESLWIGLYVGILAWLQLGRALTPLSALIPALGLIALETLLLTNEKNKKPS